MAGAIPGLLPELLQNYILRGTGYMGASVRATRATGLLFEVSATCQFPFIGGTRRAVIGSQTGVGGRVQTDPIRLDVFATGPYKQHLVNTNIRVFALQIFPQPICIPASTQADLLTTHPTL